MKTDTLNFIEVFIQVSVCLTMQLHDLVDLYIRRIFALKLGTPRFFVVLAMAYPLEDALNMVSASFDLGLFLDDGTEMGALLSAFHSVEIESCADFRFAFVTDDLVDLAAVDGFAVGDLSQFRDLIIRFAEEVIPDGAFSGDARVPCTLRKRSCPSHSVGGRLVYRKLEDYVPVSAGPSTSKDRVLFQPSSAAARLKESALKSHAKLAEKLSSGHVEVTSGHFWVGNRFPS